LRGDLPSAQSIGAMIQGLVTQFVPSAALMRINWAQVGEQALNGLVSALPSIAIGLVSLFGKRDLSQERIDFQQLLATLPVDKIAQLVQTVITTNNGLITNVLTKVRALLQKFFPQYQGRIDFDQFTNTVLNTLVNTLPQLGVSWLSSFFGKRNTHELASLISSIDIAHLIPELQQFVNHIDLQQLQSQFSGLLISALANHIDIKELAPMLQALITQFIPSAASMRINWDKLGQQALNGLVTALPSIAIGLVSLLG